MAKKITAKQIEAEVRAAVANEVKLHIVRFSNGDERHSNFEIKGSKEEAEETIAEKLAEMLAAEKDNDPDFEGTTFSDLGDEEWWYEECLVIDIDILPACLRRQSLPVIGESDFILANDADDLIHALGDAIRFAVEEA